jgi:hypothetical protein
MNYFPILYNLYFNISMNNENYNGYNKIILQVNNNINKIQFHSKNLDITQIKLDDIIIHTNNISYDSYNDLCIIDCNCNIGHHLLTILFNGKITNYDGLVKSDKCIYTRFEPICARKCYPCFDEPNYKVKYLTSIQIDDPSYTVLYNTDHTTIQQLSNNNILYKFAETIPMSSYLSSFVISKFNFLEAITKNNIRLRVYVPYEDDINSGKFALECGIKMLDFVINYYNISFPYNKIDFIPIDGADVAGMENYGLIFYRDDCLLLNNNTSVIYDKIEIAHVISHELAHQWFGNLISIDKWNNLWLKESFAKFFEYYIVLKIFPEWDCFSMFVVNILKTLDFDQVSYKTIKVKHIHNPKIDRIYNKLTYYKGALLLNIILNYIGEEQFKINIQNYLQANKHSVINNEIFINAICQNVSSDKQNNIKEFINEFINNNSFPIVYTNNNNLTIKSFDFVNIINNNINNNIHNLNNISKYISIYDGNNIQIYNGNNIQIYNDSVKINNLINNKNMCYYRVCYSKTEFLNILNTIHLQPSKQQISIYSDLFYLGIYSICSFEYWISYTIKLIQLLLSFQNCNQYNFYLIELISKDMKLIKSIIKNSKLVKLFNELISKLISLFNVYDINTYTKQDLYDDNILHNSIIFLLIELNEDNTFINYIFDNKLFNLYGSLNNIVIKRIITNNDLNRIIKFKYITNEFPFMFYIIKDLLIYSNNKKLIKTIFNQQIIDNDYNYISDLLSENKYFVELYTDYIINNSHLLKTDDYKIISLIDDIIINQTNLDKIYKLLNILKKLKINISTAKNTLFNKLYIKCVLFNKL